MLKILLAHATFVCECEYTGTFLILNFCFFNPSKKRHVTQSSKPDDHIEKPNNLALIVLSADHSLLNSTLDGVVGVVEPVGCGRRSIAWY